MRYTVIVPKNNRDSGILDEIRQALTKIHDNHTKIKDIRQSSSGWESDIYIYTLENFGQTQNLVIRILQGDNSDGKLQVEQVGMQKLYQMGYPVPHIHQFAPSAESPFETAYLVMDYVAGHLLGNDLEDTTALERQVIFTRFAQLVTDLHQLHWRNHLDYPFVQESSYAFLENQLVQFRGLCEQLLPEFLPILKWVEKHYRDVPCPELSILHGDFHPWNVLQTPDERLVVIDWSGFALGDRQYDVMWTWLLLTNRHHPTWGDEFVQAYQQVSGHDLAGKEFYRGIAWTRRIIDIYRALKHGAEGGGLRAEAMPILKSQIPEVRWMLEQLATSTNTHLPEVERFFAEISAEN